MRAGNIPRPCDESTCASRHGGMAATSQPQAIGTTAAADLAAGCRKHFAAGRRITACPGLCTGFLHCPGSRCGCFWRCGHDMTAGTSALTCCVRFIVSLRIVLQIHCQEESRGYYGGAEHVPCRWQGATGRGNFDAVLATRRQRLHATFVSCVETRLSTQFRSVGKLGGIAQAIVFAAFCRNGR